MVLNTWVSHVFYYLSSLSVNLESRTMVLLGWVSHVFRYLSSSSVTLESTLTVLVTWVSHMFHYLSSLSVTLESTIMVLVTWVSHVFYYLSSFSVTLESTIMVMVAWVNHVFHYLSSLLVTLESTIMAFVTWVRHVLHYLSSSSVRTSTWRWKDICPILMKTHTGRLENVWRFLVSIINVWPETIERSSPDVNSFVSIDIRIICRVKHGGWIVEMEDKMLFRCAITSICPSVRLWCLSLRKLTTMAQYRRQCIQDYSNIVSHV